MMGMTWCLALLQDGLGSDDLEVYLKRMYDEFDLAGAVDC